MDTLEWLNKWHEEHNPPKPPKPPPKHLPQNVLLKKYGLTLEAYMEMVDRQQGKCLICKEEKERLVVDHCHTRGKVRGLLCNLCNSLLGFSRENIDTLLSAIAYIKQHSTI